MSRTYRKKPKCFRKPSTIHIIRLEIAAINHLSEAFEPVPNRLVNRGSVSGCIPSAYDDLSYYTREKSRGNRIGVYEAARLLNASVEYVEGLVRSRQLNHWVESGDVRLAMRDVMEFKERTDSDRRKVLDEMVALNQGMGLYD